MNLLWWLIGGAGMILLGVLLILVVVPRLYWKITRRCPFSRTTIDGADQAIDAWERTIGNDWEDVAGTLKRVKEEKPSSLVLGG